MTCDCGENQPVERTELTGEGRELHVYFACDSGHQFEMKFLRHRKGERFDQAHIDQLVESISRGGSNVQMR
jgi:hypothetical protein